MQIQMLSCLYLNMPTIIPTNRKRNHKLYTLLLLDKKKYCFYPPEGHVPPDPTSDNDSLLYELSPTPLTAVTL